VTRIVLASASPGRRKVLRQAGIDPLVIVSGVDEDAVIARMDPTATPGALTTALAAAKADAVAHALDPVVAADCVVVGCDSMLYCAGQLNGKPSSPQDVLRAWQMIAGHTGELHTGHCVIRLRDKTVLNRSAESNATAVRFATPSEDELTAYVASGEPLGVAGGFTLDGLGGWFVDGVDGDPSNVIGISLPLTRRLLRDVGVSIARLWACNPVV